MPRLYDEDPQEPASLDVSDDALVERLSQGTATVSPSWRPLRRAGKRCVFCGAPCDVHGGLCPVCAV